MAAAGLGNLRLRIARVSRIGRARSLACAAAGVAAAVSVVFLAVSLLDVLFWLPVPLRLAGFAGVLSAAFLLGRKLWTRHAAEVEPGHAARTVEDRFPEIGRSLSTAIEFGSDPDRARRLSSPEIVSALIDGTEARAKGLDFRRAVEWRGAIRWSALAALLLMIVATYWTLLPQLAGPSFARLINPVSGTAPPTWTVIENVEPGNAEVNRGGSTRVAVRLEGSPAKTVTLEYRTAGVAEWSRVEMAEVGERTHARTLVNISQPVEYAVRAGDALSRKFVISPVEEPRVTSLRATVVPPAYTGLVSERLPEGAGDVRAVAGSMVEVEVSAAEGAVSAVARLRFDVADDEAVELTRDGEGVFAGRFAVARSGAYSIELRDATGRGNDSTRVVYNLNAVEDRPPRVDVFSPEPDVMAAADQEVVIELRARDDWGVAEYGIVLNVTGARERVTIERPARGVREAAGSYKLRLGLRDLRGGEVVSYHAYARDANDVTGPGEAAGDLRFIRIYDEDRYGMPASTGENEPRHARAINRLVERQMEAMRSAFDAARGGASVEDAASLQTEVRRELTELVGLVRSEEDSGLSSSDFLLLEGAGEEMAKAARALNEGRAEDAIDPGARALALLSRARRLVLSENGSGSGMTGALEDADRERESRRRAERRRDLDELEEEARKMPPMLERARRERRRLERLEDEPPAPREAGQLADRQDRMAQSLREQASRLEEASRRDREFPTEPRRRLLEAAEELEASARAGRQGDGASAASSAREAEGALEQAEAAARRGLRAADQDRLSGAGARAEELARAQRELSEGGDAADVELQERLRAELDDLRREVDSLSSRAEREGRAERDELAQASLRLRRAEMEMDRAERALRGGRAEEAPDAQDRAARELNALAQALGRAGERSRMSERESLAESAKRAGDLSAQAGRLADAARGTAPDAAAISRGVDELGGEAESLSRQTMLLPGGAGSDIDEARQALARAGDRLERSRKALARSDMAMASDELDRAGADYARAEESLKRGAARDIERAFTEAAQAARRSADAVERANREIEPGRAAAEKRRAAAQAERAERRLESAAKAASTVGSEIAELAARESARAVQENIAGRLAREGASAEEGEHLLDEARRFAGRMETLAAEARGDEVQALRRLAEDATDTAARLEEFREANDLLTNGEDIDPRARRDAAMRAEGLADDLRNMRGRLARHIPDALLEQVEGFGGSIGGTIAAAEGELVEMARRLTRNQEPKESAYLGGGAAAHAAAGRRVIETLEAVMRQRDLRAPDDETVPEAYRELVERYFRALSED